MAAVDLNFGIVDPHIHLWDPYTTPRLVSPAVKIFGRFPRLLNAVAGVAFPRSAKAFVGRTTYVAAPYMPVDYNAATAPYRIDSIVHVQAGWHDPDPMGPVGETRWLETLDYAKADITLGALVAEGVPESAHFSQLLDAHLAASDRVRGIRAMAAWHPDPGVFGFHDQPGRYSDPAFIDGLQAMIDRQLRFDAWCYSDQLGSLTAIAQRYPELPIMLDHLGTPAGVLGPVGRHTGQTAMQRSNILAAWRESLAELAACGNVHCKLSGLLMPVLGHGFAARNRPPSADEIAERLSPLVSHALAVFGPERCVFASNFPMDQVCADLPTVIDAYAQMVADQAPDALRAVFRDNALAFYDMVSDG